MGHSHPAPLQKLLVTGGAGFIGSNFVHRAISAGHSVINLDALTYAGNLDNLASLASNRRHVFVHGDVGDASLLSHLLGEHQPHAIVHFAAESHVDRSVPGPEIFLRTNILGTFALLEAALAYWRSLASVDAQRFRLVHISTDEVYGSLAPAAAAFREDSPYAPSSPYAASKASSDHLARAWFHTYGLPVLITNCSNNYGPFQFPEKLVPLMIHNALSGKPLPLYGDGLNVRDWIYVSDHCEALLAVLERGRIGETYNIGGMNQQTNREVVAQICEQLDRLHPAGAPHDRLISFVADRPGHDRRYAIDYAKIQSELGWNPRESFPTGLEKTVRWYIEHDDWTNRIISGEYRNLLTQDAQLQNHALRNFSTPDTGE